MNTVNDLLKNKQGDSEDLKKRLNILVNLLKCWDLCISHIKALEKVSIIDIKSFPTIMFDVIIGMLSHCKTR